MCKIYYIIIIIYCRLAIGSFVEEYNNKVQIVSLDEEISEFSPKSTFDHPYPTTKIMWIPDSVSYYTFFILKLLIKCVIFQKGVFPDLLATSGDYLRIWRAGEPETRLECILNNVSVYIYYIFMFSLIIFILLLNVLFKIDSI